MPKEFWAKAVDCGVYLSNYFPNPSVWNKTPQQAWNGRKQNISHLRVFESIAYAHVSDQKWSKLDDKSEKYIFICYDSSSKGYRLYNPNKGKIIISRDVKFNEDEAWDWGAQEGDYDTLPLYEEEEQTMGSLQEITTPLSPSTHEVPTTSSLLECYSGRTLRYRSLQEIYEVIKDQNDLTLVDSHFSRASPLDRRDSLFICEKLIKKIIFGKVEVTTYFIFILKGK